MREQDIRARLQAFAQSALRVAVPVGIGLALAGCGDTGDKYGAPTPDAADTASDTSSDSTGQP